MGRIIESGKFTDYARILFEEDSQHTLNITCRDRLGNLVTDNEIFYVDSNPPATSKTYGIPTLVNGSYRWITSATPITLSAWDEKIGVDKTYYNVTLMDLADKECTETCGSLEIQFVPTVPINWVVYQSPFTIPEDSCHRIMFYSVDKFGSTEQVRTQCVFVDNTAPVTSATTGSPKVACAAGENCDYWIRDHVTPVTLSCYDQNPHPSGVKMLEYRWKLDDGEWTSWTTYTAPIIFNEDSWHYLQYRCTDNMGNMREGPGKTYRVDSIAPTTTKTYSGPYYKVDSTEWIDTASRINLGSVDGGSVCAVGLNKTYFKITRYTSNYSACYDPAKYCVPGSIQVPAWAEYNGSFGIGQDSCHMIEYYSVDKLGNTEAVKAQCFFVDKNPPSTSVWYGSPQFSLNGTQWISSGTPVYIKATDANPHPSGVSMLYWRVGMVADGYCRNETACGSALSLDKAYDSATPKIASEYDVNFTIPEQSCHMIEYYAVDNVNKTEAVNRKCVYVDNTPPVPNKTVGEPKSVWDGKDSNFYPGIGDRCWSSGENSMECWRTTILTPISLECTDPQPHPVDNERVCFKVELDGSDETSNYCKYYKGQMANDSYCCLDSKIKNFYFNEVSEHNLAYYCVDALGNKGPVDDEKFKVEETKFEIQLNKKWNLISVPVSLLDNSISEVFKSVKNTVKSVWTYDAVTGNWYVYTPDNNTLNDNLNTMLPGWGYWVLSNDSDKLVIGGSLFKPAVLPPSKEIKANSWNLIGYYGAEGLPGYYGPQKNNLNMSRKTAYCELLSLMDTWDDLGFASLLSYWEPFNPKAWNTHYPNSQGLDRPDRMSPGAGYWVYTKENGLFVPPTACDP